MNELIPLHSQTINGNAIETVSARELYEALGLDKSNWARWTKQNIVNNPFAVNNSDYVGFVMMTNGNETTDYALVIDFAKKLAMQVKTSKGELVRNYFIECEKQLKSNQRSLPRTYAEALRAYADEVEARELAEKQLAIAQPKVQYFDKLVERNLLTNFTTTAKEFGIKRKAFIAYLLDNGYIYRDQSGNLLPYAVHTPHLFEIKEYSKDQHSGVQTLITPKGRETLRILMSEVV